MWPLPDPNNLTPYNLLTLIYYNDFLPMSSLFWPLVSFWPLCQLEHQSTTSSLGVQLRLSEDLQEVQMVLKKEFVCDRLVLVGDEPHA